MQVEANALRWLRRAVAVTLVLLASGCATPVFDYARALHYSGDSNGALAVLQEAEQSVPDRDTLLLLLERGTLELHSGQPELAARSFVAAADYIEEQDRISLRDETRALVSSEATTRYTGELSEKLLTHTYAMLSFLLSNQPESAAVEARRATAKLASDDDTLEGAFFTQALIALSFEMAGQYNDAYVAARKLPASSYALTTNRLATRLGSGEPRRAVSDELKQAFENASGELILVIEKGRVSRKRSSHLFNGIDWQIAFPAYPSRTELPQTVALYFDDREPAISELAQSDVDQLARRALDARAGALLLRQGLRVAAKHQLINELQSKDDLAAQLLAFAILASEVADTRGWYTLPAYLELRRVPVPKGAKSLSIQANGAVRDIDVSQLDFARGPVIELLRF